MLPSDLIADWLDADINASEESEWPGAWEFGTSGENERAKMYKSCPSQGNCTFNAHFFRNFQTGDAASDYQVEKDTNTVYEVYGFAAEYNDLFSGDRVTTYYEVGPDQNIYLENLSGIS